MDANHPDLNSRRSKALVASTLIFVAVVITFSLWPGGEATAIPDHEVFIWFYSDSSKTEVVGSRSIRCDGVETVGTITPYFHRIESSIACPDVLVVCIPFPCDPLPQTCCFPF